MRYAAFPLGALLSFAACGGGAADPSDPSAASSPDSQPQPSLIEFYRSPEDRSVLVPLYRTALAGDPAADAHLRGVAREHPAGLAASLLERFHRDLADLAAAGSEVALGMIRAAVDADSPDGFAALGLLLVRGSDALGLASDDRAAFRWFERAAARAHDGARLELCRGGLFGWSGRPALSDPAAGYQLCAEAVRYGYTPAMVELARAYSGGYGVAPSMQQALNWLDMATTAGHGPAARISAEYYRDGVPSAGLRSSPASAVSFWTEAIRLGDRPSVTALAMYHERGPAEVRDPALSAAVWRFGWRETDGGAGAWGLARAYRCGIGTAVSAVDADHWEAEAVASAERFYGMPDPDGRVLFDLGCPDASAR